MLTPAAIPYVMLCCYVCYVVFSDGCARDLTEYFILSETNSITINAPAIMKVREVIFFMRAKHFIG